MSPTQGIRPCNLCFKKKKKRERERSVQDIVMIRKGWGLLSKLEIFLLIKNQNGSVLTVPWDCSRGYLTGA